MTLLKNIVDFCLEHQLMSSENTNRTLAEFERHYIHPIRVVISVGVSEEKLFTVASKEFDIPLTDLKGRSITANSFDVLSKNIADQFFCLPLSSDENQIELITWNWTKIEVITKGIKNITGKTVQLKLATCSEFDRIYSSNPS
jgi:hypothetical protein